MARYAGHAQGLPAQSSPNASNVNAKMSVGRLHIFAVFAWGIAILRRDIPTFLPSLKKQNAVGMIQVHAMHILYAALDAQMCIAKTVAMLWWRITREQSAGTLSGW
jgi:hypothetical protein